MKNDFPGDVMYEALQGEAASHKWGSLIGALKEVNTRCKRWLKQNKPDRADFFVEVEELPRASYFSVEERRMMIRDRPKLDASNVPLYKVTFFGPKIRHSLFKSQAEKQAIMDRTEKLNAADWITKDPHAGKFVLVSIYDDDGVSVSRFMDKCDIANARSFPLKGVKTLVCEVIETIDTRERKLDVAEELIAEIARVLPELETGFYDADSRVLFSHTAKLLRRYENAQ